MAIFDIIVNYFGLPMKDVSVGLNTVIDGLLKFFIPELCSNATLWCALEDLEKKHFCWTQVIRSDVM